MYGPEESSVLWKIAIYMQISCFFHVNYVVGLVYEAKDFHKQNSIL